MKSITRLDQISDGKLYDIRDMVKADAGGCEGCSACCHGVGELVELTPYDVYEIRRATGFSFDQLLEEKLCLRQDGKLLIPYLGMVGNEERCSFLNESDRCSIHEYRPNICRLFPLGRVYDQDDFKYFLQVDACVKPKLSKVKVKKWIGIHHYAQNKGFILSWYHLMKALAFRMKFVRDEEEIENMNQILQDGFYRMEMRGDESFYDAYNKILPKVKNELGIL